MESFDGRSALRSPPPPSGLDMALCPQCEAPAEIARRDLIGSTDGPVVHIYIRCIHRHWFYMPAGSQ